MDKIWDAIDTLVYESGGGVKTSETLGRQGIRGLALLLEDGRVAFVMNPPAAAAALPPLARGGFEGSGPMAPLLKGAGSANGADWGIPSQGGADL